MNGEWSMIVLLLCHMMSKISCILYEYQQIYWTIPCPFFSEASSRGDINVVECDWNGCAYKKWSAVGSAAWSLHAEAHSFAGLEMSNCIIDKAAAATNGL